MFSKESAFLDLQVSLEKAIQKWSEDNQGSDAWECVGYVGDNAQRLMAKAAIAVLESSADVQDYLKRDGQLTE